MNRDWRAQAKCRDQAPDFDYSVDGETPTERQQRLDAAVRTCHRCPVRAACEADIDRTMDDGVRAGMVLDKIRNVRAGGGFGDVVEESGRKVRLPREHGTLRGYMQHNRRRDLPACQPCRDAKQADKAARRKRAA